MSTILITGANRGIGLELTRQFAADGWEVLACTRNPATANDLTALQQDFTAVRIYELDVTNYEQLDALAVQLQAEAIDVLVNNAGVITPRAQFPEQVDPTGWRQILEVNTIAPLMIVCAFLPHITRSNKKLIANISSAVGSIEENTSGGSYFYRSSKTALNQVGKSLSVDLADRGVTVLQLHPGWVLTEMGGPSAMISAAVSAAGLKQLIESATPQQNGHFYRYNGEEIPW